jgi:CelD/BcsL family acetyltransferase involved in cellulose biosynthesis
MRRALPIGISITDYLDVLIDPSCSDDAGAALMNEIAAQTAGLASWEFTELAPWAAALQLDCPSFYEEERDTCAVCPQLRIPSHAKSLKEFVPSHRLQSVRTAWNRMRKTNRPEIVVANEANADELFAALVSLHAKRWHHLGSALPDPCVQRFHRAAVPALAAAGLLRLFALLYCDRYIAVHYGLHHRQRSYAYLVGFDAAFEAFSPGSVLYSHAIDTALAEGATEFDFLRGGEPYKYLWGARDQESVRRVLRCRMASVLENLVHENACI